MKHLRVTAYIQQHLAADIFPCSTVLKCNVGGKVLARIKKFLLSAPAEVSVHSHWALLISFSSIPLLYGINCPLAS
jgi:hypothetical protein